MHFKQKLLRFILTHTILVLATVGLGHGVYRKLYALIGGQRAEKFENHCVSRTAIEFNATDTRFYLFIAR